MLFDIAKFITIMALDKFHSAIIDVFIQVT